MTSGRKLYVHIDGYGGTILLPLAISLIYNV